MKSELYVLVLGDDLSYHLGPCHLLEVISPCTRTRTKLLIFSFELVVTLSLLSMFSCKSTILPNAHMNLNLLYH
jgi:hypothetical protein